MAQVINTNSLSLLTQNNLNKSQGALNTAIERLSSGMRINSAKDDAAGQAIANRFTANIKGLSQAQRNANDGISLAQTTEGALNEINTNLQRVRELTVQSANGSNSVDDKVSIQAEIGQRLEEIDRLSAQTDFNGTKVLKEGVTTLNIQVGAKDNEVISIKLQEISVKALDLRGFNVDKSGTPNAAATVSDLKLNAGWSVGTAGTVGYTTSAGWAEGATDAVTGAVTYTQSSGKVTTAAADAYDVSFAAATRANVFSAVANSGEVQLNSSAEELSNFVFDSTEARFNATTAATVGSGSAGSAASTSGAPLGGVKSYLIPTGSAQTSATIRIGTTDQQVKIDSTGNVKDDAGNQLYLDITGNLTQNTSNNGTALEKANIGKDDGGDILKSMSEATVGSAGKVGSVLPADSVKSTGGVITVSQAGGSSVVMTIAQQSNAGATGTPATLNNNETWTVKESLTAIDMQSKSAAAANTVVDTTGTGPATSIYTIDGTTGAVTDGAAASVFVADALSTTPAAGTLTTADKRTVASVAEVVTAEPVVNYTVQTNGAVMDSAGNRVYADTDLTNVKGFTLSGRSGNTATADPLSVLDKALAKVDSLRGSLGAVQNRFDSIISNLGTTITNLSSSRSRIEDADYATEVSNMTRANILQQAGTSVLAQANQTTQGILSLLR